MKDSTKAPGGASKIVARRIKDARVQAGLSQGKLGAAIGVTFQQVQKYEKGTNRVASDRLLRIADVLGKPIGYFFTTAASGLPPADDELLTAIVAWLNTGAVPRRILAALPAIRANDVDLVAAFLERLAAHDRA